MTDDQFEGITEATKALKWELPGVLGISGSSGSNRILALENGGPVLNELVWGKVAEIIVKMETVGKERQTANY